MNQFLQYLNEAKSISDYVPERDDYLNWKDDIDKFNEYTKNAKLHPDGTYRWENAQGELHRDDDKPAAIDVNDTICMMWFKNGKYYRENDKPTHIWGNGRRDWFIPSLRSISHRDFDRPSIITPHRNIIIKVWKKNNKQYWPITSIKKAIEFDGLSKLSCEFYLHEPRFGTKDPFPSELGLWLIERCDNFSDSEKIKRRLFEFIQKNYNKLPQKYPKIYEFLRQFVLNNLDQIDQFKHIPEIREEFFGHIALNDLGI